ncbi:MAG: TetR/AcrR family transcriptional regulator [Phaeodactylibacter sp.]|nr:TetR/AcrR family transcriptional regulator [Phaeodactylibacter sp.]MCB9264562.1 TetR/AcrR family transcriptional regulator [Lewinellaceae bacterium]MCB9287335.1 TetR/AcrR family transcriptional regulator [Lewinellaceae bacterium]
MELKQHILNKSYELFMRYGIKSVTMDDIARELGMSKKTLYQYVDNKSDLIEQIFRQHVEEEKRAIERIRSSSADAVDEILKIARYVLEKLRELSPTTVYDLQKYYRNIWKQMDTLHQRHVYTIIRENLERGIRQGVYRSGLNPDIIAKLCVAKTSLAADEEMFPVREYDIKTLYWEYIDYHIHGIASAEGQRLMEKYKAAVKNQVK